MELYVLGNWLHVAYSVLENCWCLRTAGASGRTTGASGRTTGASGRTAGASELLVPQIELLVPQVELLVPQVVEYFSAFYAAWNVITVFTKSFTGPCTESD